MHQYGISDDTCAPFVGLNWLRGFSVAAMTDVDDVQSHQCYLCDWGGKCDFVKKGHFNLYGVDEFGVVLGEQQMMAEIYARGPLACSLNSEPASFDAYKSGIITCDPDVNGTDHVVVIAGYGVDKTSGKKYWVGRNSYGTQWGEGASGGWFRLERGKDYLGLESHHCAWAVPAAVDVTRALHQFDVSSPL